MTKMTNEDHLNVLKEIWMTVARIEGYVEGSAKGISDRLKSIEGILEEMIKRKKK